MARESVWDFAVNRIANIGNVLVKSRQQEEENIYRRQAREMQEDALRLQQAAADREKEDYARGRQALLDMDQTNQRVREIEEQYNRDIASVTQPAVMGTDLATGQPTEISPAQTAAPSPAQLQQAEETRRGALRSTLGPTSRTARVGSVTITQPSYYDLIKDEAIAEWNTSRAASTAGEMGLDEYQRLRNSTNPDDIALLGSLQNVRIANGKLTYNIIPQGSVGERNLNSQIAARDSATILRNATSDRSNVTLSNEIMDSITSGKNISPVAAQWLGAIMSEDPNLRHFVGDDGNITAEGWAQIGSANVNIMGAVSSVSPEQRQQAAMYLKDRYPNDPAKTELARILENTDQPVPASLFGRFGAIVRDRKIYDTYIKGLRSANEDLYQEVRQLADGVAAGTPGAGLSDAVVSRLSNTYGVPAQEIKEYYNALMNRNTSTEYGKLAITEARLRMQNALARTAVRSGSVTPLTGSDGKLSQESKQQAYEEATKLLAVTQQLTQVEWDVLQFLDREAFNKLLTINNSYDRRYSDPDKIAIGDIYTLNNAIDLLNGLAPRYHPLARNEQTGRPSPVTATQGVAGTPAAAGASTPTGPQVNAATPPMYPLPGINPPGIPYGEQPPPAATAPAAPQRRTGTVVTQSAPLNIRSNPGTTAPVIGAAPRGSSLNIVGDSGDWYMVQLDDERIGYVSKQFVREQGGSAPAAPAGAASAATANPYGDAASQMIFGGR